MSVFVVRAFVKMREQLMATANLAKRLADVEKLLLTHDSALRDLYQKIRPLLLPPPEPAKTKIGFGVREARARYSPKTRSKRKPRGGTRPFLRCQETFLPAMRPTAPNRNRTLYRRSLRPHPGTLSRPIVVVPSGRRAASRDPPCRLRAAESENGARSLGRTFTGEFQSIHRILSGTFLAPLNVPCFPFLPGLLWRRFIIAELHRVIRSDLKHHFGLRTRDQEP